MKEEQESLRDIARLLAGKTDVTDEFGVNLLTTPGAQIQDTSAFYAESAAALGSSATFTGPWRDTLNYNWVGAQAWADVAGTLYVDEADAATPAVTGLIAKQATSAVDPNAPTPPSGGQVTRFTPVKPVLRFIRARYINGGTGQARFNLQTSLSPLN